MGRASSTAAAFATCASRRDSTTSCSTSVATSSWASSHGTMSNGAFSTWVSIVRFVPGLAWRRQLQHLRPTSRRAMRDRLRHDAATHIAVSAALLIDFGSTWTKLRAVDVETGALLGTAQGASTVTTDINVGLDAALATLARSMNGLPSFAVRLASSSAAGGLRMVTVGLVRELTAEAARQAALGAGAKLVGAFAYRLTARDIAQIDALAPDIVLLCGG